MLQILLTDTDGIGANTDVTVGIDAYTDVTVYIDAASDVITLAVPMCLQARLTSCKEPSPHKFTFTLPGGPWGFNILFSKNFLIFFVCCTIVFISWLIDP